MSTAINGKEITNIKKGLQLARRTVEQHLENLGSMAPTDYAPSEERALQIRQNYKDTLAILDFLIEEEEKAGY
jgi:hypothetical protein